ncbi:hypothetical protein [Chelativorans sp. AA-79]|uniref:hypothetical protein n=1 Tax=Chelativorans sp. AA-79 TaxID=3028735 RepID=UPI0023F9BE9F|nr:hypothetical protein [Chelativorans sp. AA-79]WEX07854.1 hypothetical protein PVE73_17370 [Chelativorans sp. AA-79]
MQAIAAIVIASLTAGVAHAEGRMAQVNEVPAQAGPPAGYDPVAALSEKHIDTGPLVLHLKERYADRLAGMYFERERNRIVVRLTGHAAVAPETHQISGERIEVVFEPGALHTFTELMAVMEGGRATIERTLPTAHGRYVDERTGEIVIGVEPDDMAGLAAGEALAEALGAPVRIEAEEPMVLQPAILDIGGTGAD